MGQMSNHNHPYYPYTGHLPTDPPQYQLDAFLSSGLCLTKLADLAGLADDHPPHAIVPEDDRFPRFMLLGFVKP